MSAIAPDRLAERLDADDPPVLVDIRHADSYEGWHIPGSRNVDVYHELQEDREAAAAALDDLPEDREIVTVCGVGEVAAEATDVLADLGYDAATLQDGMQGWSRVHVTAPVDADVDGTVIQVARPGTGCLSHVLVSDGEAAVFDPSRYLEEYEAVLDEHGAALVAVCDTHAHADHLSGGPLLAERHGVPYHLHAADDLGVDASHVADGDVIAVGDVDVAVIHTPGHSPGSVTYALRDRGAERDAALVTGDALFHESVGRVELGVDAGIEDTDVAANAAALHDALRRLRDRPGDPLVLPAHHPGSPEPPEALPMTAVAERNPGLQRDREAFVAELGGDVPDQPPNFERIKRINAGVEALDADEDVEDLEMGPNNCAAE